MLVWQSYRYELKPNNKQIALLAKHAGTARFAYNWGLARRIKKYKETQKSSNAVEQHRQLNALKKTDFPWMYEVSKCSPQEALRDLDKAYKNFFRKIKKGDTHGFPKFKKKGKHDSFRLTGSIHVLEKTVQFPRIGLIRTKEKTDVNGRILSATVCREANRWFVSLAVERERAVKENLNGEVVGIDVGITSFATLSDGIKIVNPKYLNKKLRLLQRRSKQHSRKQKWSKNKKKSALALARLHRRIKNQRYDFLHKLSSSLAKTKSIIVLEDLNVKGMIKNRFLSRTISDVGWGVFARMLEYKTIWYGSRLVKVSPHNTSQICSSCGQKVSKTLATRWHQCPHCGMVMDRDENAAINILNLFTGSSPGSYACGDTSGGGIPINRESTSHVSLKQEADTKFLLEYLGKFCGTDNLNPEKTQTCKRQILFCKEKGPVAENRKLCYPVTGQKRVWAALVGTGSFIF